MSRWVIEVIQGRQQGVRGRWKPWELRVADMGSALQVVKPRDE